MAHSGKKAVILLSGGLDSTTVLAIAKDQKYELYAISFDYGQRHSVELACATRLAEIYGVKRHLVLPVNFRSIGGSALTDDIPVPKGRDLDNEKNIPVTYVPARNTIFLSFALAWAEVLGANDIFIGVNAIDYSGYPDCRLEFINAFEHMANLATKTSTEGRNRLTIQTPLIDLSKEQIIRQGLSLGVDYGLTSSCYDPPRQGFGCGSCDSCILRITGFKKAGCRDPISYESTTMASS